MGNPSKFKGGSSLVSFRLPTAHLEEAKKVIDEYLLRFEVSPEGYSPAAPEEAYVAKSESLDVEEVKAPVVVKKGKEGVVYSCGCVHDGFLFRRSDKCHLEVGKHIK
ncbi:MAG TPA: hypothetical protein VIV55_09845 [Flavobacterium sp.]